MSDLWSLYKKDVSRLQKNKPLVGHDQISAKRIKPKINERAILDNAIGVGRSFFGITEEPSPKKLDTRFDRKTEKALRKGDVVIEGSLDLHGRTEGEAHQMTISFIEQAVAAHKKWILVVTGKGQTGKSVLKTNFPRWCAAPSLSRHILSIREASPSHGGGGAFYICLHRNTKEGAI